MVSELMISIMNKSNTIPEGVKIAKNLLSVACQSGDMESVESLYTCTECLADFIITAGKAGHVDIVKFLFSKKGSCIEYAEFEDELVYSYQFVHNCGHCHFSLILGQGKFDAMASDSIDKKQQSNKRKLEEASEPSNKRRRF